MISVFKIAVLVLYFSILLILSLYGFHRYILLYLFLKYKKRKISPKSYFREEELPKVTVQLPIYNEVYVVGRLIDSVCKLDYPKEKLEIQVLDDSTDETKDIAMSLVEKYKSQGFNIKYFHRDTRKGFKAGALQEGLLKAEGDFIAIFDADFIPNPDFLKRTIHYFTDDSIALVQARWGHINRDFSFLTKIQSILLDGHFIIEHVARNRSGRFFNFNGTAGIWRKIAIFQAGGWDGSTLAEDLDLSYRTQLLGWKFIYLPDFSVPAELPVDINGFKNQQHRWAKGSVQAALKLLPKIMKSKIPLKIKLESFFHLTGNFTFPLMIPLAILVFPTVIIRKGLGLYDMVIVDLPLFLFATGSFALFYAFSQKELYADWDKSIKYIPFVLSLGVGLSINNTIAVLEALKGKKSEFVRTPKYGIERKDQSWVEKKYKGHRSFVPYLELAMTLYFVIVIIGAIIEEIYMTIPFLLIFFFGYVYLTYLSFFQHKKPFEIYNLEPHKAKAFISKKRI
jgi:cellulose synthase/poly-beta-1,6-N-acetylglucosamine synthase-like glycosyltransferase